MVAMNYFVNENIFTMNSGTEFSAIKRLRLFHNHNLPAKILTRNYNPQLIADLKRENMKYSDILNMYDYFQETVAIEAKNVNVRYVDVIDKYRYHIEGIDSNESLIKHKGNIIGRVQIAPTTVGLVGTIEFYSAAGDLLAKDIWDRRGFKSSTQYFHPDGSLGPQVFFDLNGKAKLEITRMNINGVLSQTMWKLLDYKGGVRRFDTENELFAFFLQELSQNEEVVYINDRPSLTAAVASAITAKGRWEFLHSVHNPNGQTVGASRNVVDYMRPLFTVYNESFDGIIVATEEQKNEIDKFFKFKNVVVLPDTYADDVRLNRTEREKTIVYLGRIAPEKNPIDALEILSRLRTSWPEARLDFYGYASSQNVQKQMEDRVKELGLRDVVNFRGYHSQEEVAKALDTAIAAISVAEGEAFGMSALQAMAHGVPVVGYKVKYGLSELIDDKRNGRLVPYASLDGAAQALSDTMTGNMVQAAYDKAQKFNEMAAWMYWKQENESIKNLFIGGEK